MFYLQYNLHITEMVLSSHTLMKLKMIMKSDEKLNYNVTASSNTEKLINLYLTFVNV